MFALPMEMKALEQIDPFPFYPLRLLRRVTPYLADNTRVALIIGLCSLLFYWNLPVKIPSFDNLPTLLSARSLFLEGNVELSETLNDPSQACHFPQREYYYLRCTPHGVYSAYPSGLIPLAYLFVAAGSLFGDDIRSNEVLWKYSHRAGALLAALTVMSFFFTLSLFTSIPFSVIWALMLAVGSGILTTSAQGIWSQSGTTLAISLYLLWRLTSKSGESAFDYFGGAMLGFMLACRTPALIWSLCFLGELFWHSRKLFVKSLIIFLLIALVVHLNYFANYNTIMGPQWIMAQRFGFGDQPFTALLGLWISPSRGILVYQPWVSLLLLLLHDGTRRRLSVLMHRHQLRNLVVTVLLASLVHLLVLSWWPMWWGGFSWGARLQLEMIPGLALICGWITWVNRRRAAYFGLVLLLFASSFPHLRAFALKDIASWMSRGSGIPSQLWKWKGGALFP